MAKTLYDTLQVSAQADQDIIDAAYLRLLQKLQDSPSSDTENQIKFLKQAYEVLASPDKRALYDQKLQNNYTAEPVQYKSDLTDSFDEWWKSSKLSWIIVATALLIGFKLFTGHTEVQNKVEIVKERETTKRQDIQLDADNTSKHLDNESVATQGLVDNTSKYIDKAANLANRKEDRQRLELEYRANAGSEILEMQRQEQAAAIERERWEQANYEKQQERQRIEKEKQYYSCLNAMLDRYTSAEASARCR